MQLRCSACEHSANEPLSPQHQNSTQHTSLLTYGTDRSPGADCWHANDVTSQTSQWDRTRMQAPVLLN